MGSAGGAYRCLGGGLKERGGRVCGDELSLSDERYRNTGPSDARSHRTPVVADLLGDSKQGNEKRWLIRVRHRPFNITAVASSLQTRRRGKHVRCKAAQRRG